MNDFITANEARALVFMELRKDKNLETFFQWIKDKSIKDKVLCGNYVGNLTNDEVNYIRYELGYSIFWNGACLWYEVDWSN